MEMYHRIVTMPPVNITHFFTIQISHRVHIHMFNMFSKHRNITNYKYVYLSVRKKLSIQKCKISFWIKPNSGIAKAPIYLPGVHTDYEYHYTPQAGHISYEMDNPCGRMQNIYYQNDRKYHVSFALKNVFENLIFIKNIHLNYFKLKSLWWIYEIRCQSEVYKFFKWKINTTTKSFYFKYAWLYIFSITQKKCKLSVNFFNWNIFT